MVSPPTAKWISCKEFLEGEYVKGIGWEDSYIKINNEKIVRVNVVGVIVYKGENFIVIDDGSGSIYVNTELSIKNNGELGDIVMVIGRPRNYNNRNYIGGEIISKIDKEWFNKRKPKEEAVIKDEEVIKKDEEFVPKQILESMKKENIVKKIIFEKKEGIGRDQLFNDGKKKGLKEDEIEKIVEELLKRGEIYEAKPNYYKVL